MLCGFSGSLGFGRKGRRGDARLGRVLNACLVGMFKEKRFDGAHTVLYASVGQPVINLSGGATTGQHSGMAKFSQLLAKGGLTNAGGGVNRADGLFTAQQKGQDHQPLRLGVKTKPVGDKGGGVA